MSYYVLIGGQRAGFTGLTALASGRCSNTFRSTISNLLYRIIAWALTVKLLSGECHRAWLMRCQHWFRLWFGAVRCHCLILDAALPHRQAMGCLCEHFEKTDYVTRGTHCIQFFLPLFSPWLCWRCPQRTSQTVLSRPHGDDGPLEGCGLLDCQTGRWQIWPPGLSPLWLQEGYKYRKISNIRRTKSPNLNVPRLVLQLYLPQLLMPGN